MKIVEIIVDCDSNETIKCVVVESIDEFSGSIMVDLFNHDPLARSQNNYFKLIENDA